jgi:ketosteroid isomerase-like protein
MSEENIEVVRGLHESFNQIGMKVIRDALLQDEDFASTALALEGLGLSIDDDVEVKLVASGMALPDLPAGTSLRGPDGFLAFWRAWLEPWEDLDYEYGNFTQSGDDVVMDIALSAHGRESGIPVHVRVSQVWTVRDGKVARLLVFDTRDEALEAAGLSE